MSQGQINFKFTGDTTDLNRKIQETQSRLRQTTQAAEQQTEAISQAVRRLGAVVGIGFGVAQVKVFAQQIINTRAEIQALERSFETLAGKELGRKLFADIKQFAVTTPMMMKDLAKGAQTLLGFNYEAEKVMPTLRALGDISMGDSQRFASLTLAFAQMSATGKLMGQDLLQMINAGFNPLAVISEKTGKSIAELKDEMSKGAISAKMIEEAFLAATSEGGKFNDMLLIQSQTIGGAMSNLQGAVDDMMNALGTNVEGVVADAILQATDLVKNYEKVGKEIAALIGAYGLYKASVMACIAVERAQYQAHLAHMAGLTKMGALTTILKEKTDALTASMMKNPYALIGAAIAAVGYGIYKLATYETDAEKAMRKLDETTKDYNKNIAEERVQLDRLFAKLKTAKEGTEEYKNVKDAIQSKYGDLLANQREEVQNLTDIATAYSVIIESIKEKARQEALTKVTQEASSTFAEETGEINEKIYKTLQKKFKGQTDTDGVALADVYFEQVKSALEKGEQASDELLAKFDEEFFAFGDQTGTIRTKNKLQNLVNDYQKQTRILNTTLAEAERKFGTITQAAPDTPATTETEKDPEDAIKKYQADRNKALQDAHKAEIDLRKSQLRDRIAIINLEEQEELRAIEQARKDFIAKQRANGYTGAVDTSAFDRNIHTAKQKYNIQRGEVRAGYAKGMTDVIQERDTNGQQAEISALEHILSLTTTLNDRLSIQAEIRRRALNLALDQLHIQRQEELDQVKGDTNAEAVINAKYDEQERKARQEMEVRAQKETTEENERIYKEYTNRLIGIDQWKESKTKEIKENALLSKTEKATALNEVEEQSAFLVQDAAADLLGGDEGVAQALQTMVTDALSQSASVIREQIENLKKELAILAKDPNADPKQAARLTANIATLETANKKAQNSIGKESEKSAADIDKVRIAFMAVNTAVDAVAEAVDKFGTETQQKAVEAMKQVATTSLGLISAIGNTARVSAEGIKTVERASVILAIISAALQVATAIANVVMQYFTRNAQIEMELDKSRHRVDLLKDSYRDLEREKQRALGIDYYKGQTDLIKELNRQQAEYNRQLALSIEQQQIANTEKKKEQARENANEAKDALYQVQDQIKQIQESLYSDLLTTDLKTYSQSLAESIVEGFDNGLSNLDDIWNKAFRDLMRSQITKQLALYLETQLADVTEAMQRALEGDQQITEQEYAKIEQLYQAREEASKKVIDEFEKTMDRLGINDLSQDPAERGIGKMTQETAEELNGRFTAIQITTANIDRNLREALTWHENLFQVATDQLSSLREIADNTALLRETNRRLQAIENHTAKL